MLAYRLADRQEDDARLLEFLAEGGRDADAVEHRVDCDLARALDPGAHLLLLDRDAELLVDLADFGVALVQAVEIRLLLGRRLITCVMVVARRPISLHPVGRRPRQ